MSDLVAGVLRFTTAPVERRSKVRPVSTLRVILDITHQQIRKTSETSDCFREKK